MFSQILHKLSEYGENHQALFAIIVTLSLISISWGVESILELYFFPKKPVYGYIIAIAMGLILLWLTKHYILHEI